MKRAICIIGSPFCGTTLTGLILGEHSQITNVGEFMCRYCHEYPEGPEFEHHYFAAQPLGKGFCVDRARCRIDKRTPCSVWDGFKHYPPHDIYAQLRGYLGAKCIVDVTKMGNWFQEVILEESDKASVLLVVMSKDPWAWLASLRYYHRRSGKDVGSDAFAVNAATQWATHYRQARRVAEMVDHVFLKYEDLARHPKWAAKRIHEAAGLEPEAPTLLAQNWRKQHPIDGNYKLSEKVINGPVEIVEDKRGDQIPQDIRDKMLAVDDVAELREWLGRA